jgi:hypothetical protein
MPPIIIKSKKSQLRIFEALHERTKMRFTMTVGSLREMDALALGELSP